MNEYETIIKGMHLGVSKHLMDKHFTVLWANERAYDLAGYTKDEFRIRYHNKVDEYYEGDNATFEYVTKVVEEAYKKQKTAYTIEFSTKPKRGMANWVQVSGMFSHEQYRGIPVIWNVFFDITDTFEAQRELVRKSELLDNELREVDNMKCWASDFLSELNNDARSLVNIITGMTDAIEIHTDDSTFREKYMKNVKAACKKLRKRIYEAHKYFQQETQ